MALDGGGKGEHLAAGEFVAQQRVGAQNPRHDAGGGGAEAPRHGNVVALGDAQPLEGDAQLVIDRTGAAEHQIVGTCGNVRAVRGGDLDAVGFLEGENVVHGYGKSQRVKPRAHIGAGGGNSNFYHERTPFIVQY